MSLDDFLEADKIHNKVHVADAIFNYSMAKEQIGLNKLSLNTVDFYDYYYLVKQDLKTNLKETKKLYKNDFNIFVNFYTIVKSNFPDVRINFDESVLETLEEGERE